MTDPLDEKIDEILQELAVANVGREHPTLTKTAKSQLLAEILKGKDTYEKAYSTSQSNLRGVNIEAVSVAYISELFKEIE